MSKFKRANLGNTQNAERQAFVKELMGGKITNERYATFL